MLISPCYFVRGLVCRFPFRSHFLNIDWFVLLPSMWCLILHSITLSWGNELRCQYSGFMCCIYCRFEFMDRVCYCSFWSFTWLFWVESISRGNLFSFSKLHISYRLAFHASSFSMVHLLSLKMLHFEVRMPCRCLGVSLSFIAFACFNFSSRGLV